MSLFIYRDHLFIDAVVFVKVTRSNFIMCGAYLHLINIILDIMQFGISKFSLGFSYGVFGPFKLKGKLCLTKFWKINFRFEIKNFFFLCLLKHLMNESI